MDLVSQVRAYSYLSAVLSNREGDPFCRSCNSFLSSLTALEESIRKFQLRNGADIEKLPDDFHLHFLVARSRLSGLVFSAQPVNQKGKGNCKLPVGVCFLKSSLRTLQQIEQINQ